MQPELQAIMQMGMNFLLPNNNLPPQSPLAFSGYRANTQSFQPGLLQSLVGWMNPSMSYARPPTMMQSDFEHIQRMTKYRQDMERQYTQNSAAGQLVLSTALSKAFGADKAKELMDSMKQVPMMSSVYNYAFRSIFGPGIEAQRYGSARDMSQFFSGYRFQNAPFGQTYGPARDELEGMVSGIEKLTYKDKIGMVRRRQAFGMSDMSDIAMLAVKYGGQAINKDQIVNQTESLANLLEAGMSVYGTMDKEGVIQNLMELTRGKIPITNTSQLESMMYRINALAKVANVSMDAMHKIAEEGARIYESAGLSPAQGAVAAAGSVAFTKMTTSGKNAVYTPEQVAKLGGAAKIREMSMLRDVDFMGSNYMTGASYSFSMAKTMEEKQAIMERIKRGETFDLTQFDAAQAAEVAKMEKDPFYKGNKTHIMQALKGKRVREAGERREELLKNMYKQFGVMGVKKITALQQAKGFAVALPYRNEQNLLNVLKKAETDPDTKQKLIDELISLFMTNGMKSEDAIAQATELVTSATVKQSVIDEEQNEVRRTELSGYFLNQKRQGTLLEPLMRAAETQFKDVGMARSVANTFSGFDVFKKGKVRNKKEIKEALESLKRKGMTDDRLKQQYMDWFGMDTTMTQYDIFSALTGDSVITREDIFGGGDKSIYASFNKGIKAISENKESFGSLAKKLYGEGVSSTLLSDIYESMGKDTPLNLKNFQDILRQKTGKDLSINSPGLMKLFLGYLKDMGKAQGAKGDKRGETLLTNLREADQWLLNLSPEMRSLKLSPDTIKKLEKKYYSNPEAYDTARRSLTMAEDSLNEEYKTLTLQEDLYKNQAAKLKSENRSELLSSIEENKKEKGQDMLKEEESAYKSITEGKEEAKAKEHVKRGLELLRQNKTEELMKFFYGDIAGDKRVELGSGDVEEKVRRLVLAGRHLGVTDGLDSDIFSAQKEKKEGRLASQKNISSNKGLLGTIEELLKKLKELLVQTDKTQAGVNHGTT